MSVSRICEYTVLNINIFNVEYHAIIEIVELGRVEYANIEVLAHSHHTKMRKKVHFGTTMREAKINVFGHFFKWRVPKGDPE